MHQLFGLEKNNHSASVYNRIEGVEVQWDEGVEVQSDEEAEVELDEAVEAEELLEERMQKLISQYFADVGNVGKKHGTKACAGNPPLRTNGVDIGLETT